jgi:hypothetical protein
MRQSEAQHNTDEQVREYLTAALAIVGELDPPGDLRVPLFTKAVDLLSAKQIFFEQPQPFQMPPMAITKQRH